MNQAEPRGFGASRRKEEGGGWNVESTITKKTGGKKTYFPPHALSPPPQSEFVIYPSPLAPGGRGRLDFAAK